MRELYDKSPHEVDQIRIQVADILTLQVKKKIDEDTLEDYFENHLHGSGWDGNWHVDETSTAGSILATIEYHHLNEDGYYDGWSMINVYLTPTLDIKRITYSADRRQRDEYIRGQEDYYESCIHDAVSDIREELLQEVFAQRNGITTVHA